MYPQAYIQYLIHFHGDRDYFECHEILEAYWKEKPKGQRDAYLVGFIQIAVSLYHYRRANMEGAKRMMQSALRILSGELHIMPTLGLDATQLIELLTETLHRMQTNEPYTDINLPLIAEDLKQLCDTECKKLGFIWGQSSNTANIYLINKHTLRDRTDVIAERNKQIQKRQR
ncbi:DUF309 domain-containing protein [Ectobacillus sp. JY-23]|uniref:DUF309 domain-containing protein n=1 Tax=Ectobacillus sp. JY-23 TaxID=2933872 RepID=UPI001FF6AA31|nr:DUF309 domain-containing protein [Ectobacillus sp. JY-23]UOY93851.1 DUF309 domain-containing protein [Ectobacillus sp. JY-23]